MYRHQFVFSCCKVGIPSFIVPIQCTYQIPPLFTHTFSLPSLSHCLPSSFFSSLPLPSRSYLSVDLRQSDTAPYMQKSVVFISPLTICLRLFHLYFTGSLGLCSHCHSLYYSLLYQYCSVCLLNIYPSSQLFIFLCKSLIYPLQFTVYHLQ